MALWAKVSCSVQPNISSAVFREQDHDHPSFLTRDVTTRSRELPASKGKERAGEQAEDQTNRDGFANWAAGRANERQR